MDEQGADDWDDVPPPQSRSDRIQRITSPENTLQRAPVAGSSQLHHLHSGSLARSAQQQQLQLAAALMQQQQQQLAMRHHLDGLLEQQHHHHQGGPPSHIASLRRQAQIMALQAAQTGSLPRSSQQQMFSIPASPTSSRGMRYRSPATSLPPTTGPLRPALSPNFSSARRFSQQQLQLEPRQLDSLSRRNNAVHASAGPYWGQHEKGPFDPFVAAAAQQQAAYSGDGSTSSYARINHNNNHASRQAYPAQPLSSVSQNVEPMYNLQHDENTSLTSQKTSRTQASMLTKSAATPSGSGSGASGSGCSPQQKQSSDATGSTTISASAKYAEYISNLQKYQHPPPSKRHVTFIKYRGRQCTIAMLVVFAVLVIGLVVAPVVYFTAFANKAPAATSAAPIQLTNFINGQITLDTTHGAYADLMTDPGRPPDLALKRVQRDMEDLLKDVLHSAGGFAENDINSVMVSQPQRPDAHQIFLRFQVLLKNSQPLDVVEAKTSKAFATATITDLVGMRLKDIPIVANSLFFRAVPQSNATAAIGEMPGIVDVPSDAGSRPSDLLQLDPVGSVNSVSSRGPPTNSVSVSASNGDTKQTDVGGSSSARPTPGVVTAKMSAPSSAVPVTTSTSSPSSTTSSTPKTTPQVPGSLARTVATTAPPQLSTTSEVADFDEKFGVGVGLGLHGKKTTPLSASSSSLGQRQVNSAPPVAPPTVPSVTFTKSTDNVSPAVNENGLYSGSRVQSLVPFIDNLQQSTSQFNGQLQSGFSGQNSQSQVPFRTTPQQNQAPIPMGNTAKWQNQPQFSTTVLQTGPPDFTQVSGLPVGDFTPSTPNGNQNKNTLTTGWHSIENSQPSQPDSGTFQGPHFIQQFNPNVPNTHSQPSVFNLNMQNPAAQGTFINQQVQGVTTGTFSPNNFQPLPQDKSPNFQSNVNGVDTFNRGHETSFNGGFRLTNSPQPNLHTQSSFASSQTFQLSGFAADDASASTTMSDQVKPTAGTSSQEAETTTQTSPYLGISTKSSVKTGMAFNGTSVSSATKREFSLVPSGMNMPNGPVKNVEEAQEFPEFSDASVAPILISEWGNWSDWGSCSAPHCSSDGFQSRTRVCLTSISGAPTVPDRDASCLVNGGQPIEARPCVCEREIQTEFSSATASPTDTASPETMEELLTSTVAVVSSATTTAATTVKLSSYVAWSEWTHWSACSIEPCHSNGIQTRHRTCQADSLPVAEQTCLDQREGSSAETRPCQCPNTQTTQTTSEELLKATTETFVRPSGQFLQPQRTFSLQVPQNRPIQRRPTTKLPGTCSAFEKPCNNGQCILSYRICDGFPDCADGSDEPLGCGRCFSGEFKCTNGRCISETLVCDGTDNCGDGSDEYFC